MDEKKPTYGELLKHPLWQRKRLEVLNRDDWTCRDCGSKEKTLHVHHGYYQKGKKPWEYNTDTLATLCEDCHSVAQDQLAAVHALLGCLVGSSASLETARGFMVGLLVQSEAIGWDDSLPFSSFECVEGYGRALGFNASWIVSLIPESGNITHRQIVDAYYAQRITSKTDQ